MMADASGVCLSAPEYDQDISYAFKKTKAGSLGDNVKRARCKRDGTGIPSHVWVRGKDSQPGPKAKYVGHYDNSKQARNFKPFYLKDDQSSTKEHCDTVAAYIAGKAMREYLTYSIGVRGFSDVATGRTYTVDTVASVADEVAGIEGNMWVEARTFRKSRGGGTATDLKLLPAQAFILDSLVSDGAAPPPPPTYGAVNKKPRVLGHSYLDILCAETWARTAK